MSAKATTVPLAHLLYLGSFYSSTHNLIVDSFNPPTKADHFPDLEIDFLTKSSVIKTGLYFIFLGCSRTATSGHYHPGKSPSGVETGLSHSTVANPINVPTILSDRLPQAPEGPVAPPYSADHSPYKAELFFLDVGYSGNALHCFIVEDVHVVQTRSQARAEGKAQAVFSNPYACQLLDKAPNEGPGPSTDTSHLKGINIIIPMDTMKAHYPKLCGSILKFLWWIILTYT
ncbi:hypothetical protein DSO57_1015516 [Entomophthora muscae]|uniref:Uncharacterized protein n=1 Tax=Entomophthora muscae TaxID=34485 RepID=A0ACC2UQZ8_9FUNG|nr:hypothetical protein DSO57_1015516 [Entomophthora muscae]